MIEPKLIESYDTSAASMAAAHHARTGQRMSPYVARPERETYTVIEIYERSDGSRYSRSREVMRWGGEVSASEWSSPTELKLQSPYTI